MSMESEQHAQALERLSALVDGELDADATAQACLRWRASEADRATWHAYQLIGDVLRSDDLACEPGRDVRFVHALQVRLAKEPVVLAPRPLDSAKGAVRAGRPSRWAWMGPSAVAAGFVVVTAAVVFTRAPGGSAEPPPANEVAQALPARASGLQMAAMVTPQVDPTTSVGEAKVFAADGKLIRDARLDRYLAAHKQFAGSSALGVPSAFLRNATADAVDR